MPEVLLISNVLLIASDSIALIMSVSVWLYIRERTLATRLTYTVIPHLLFVLIFTSYDASLLPVAPILCLFSLFSYWQAFVLQIWVQ